MDDIVPWIALAIVLLAVRALFGMAKVPECTGSCNGGRGPCDCETGNR